MSMDWFRHWHGLSSDPKLSFIAKRCRRPMCEVVAVFCALLENASANEDERGTLRNWDSEITASTLDIDPDHVEAICNAMQGKLLLGSKLLGWDRRQPKREDNSAERVRAHRERKRDVTQCNAEKPKVTLDERREEEIREEIPVKTVEQDAARESAGGPAAQTANMNNSTTEIVTGIAKFLNNLAPDFETAKRIVHSNVGIYGDKAVRDGYAELMADVADNKVRVPTVKALVGYFKTAKDRGDNKPKSVIQVRQTRAEEMRAAIARMEASA